MSFDILAFATKEAFSFARNLGMRALKDSEQLNRFLAKHGLVHPENNFRSLYLHSLVRCNKNGMDPAMLELLGDPDVVMAFADFWKSGSEESFEKNIRQAIEMLKPGDEIKARRIDVTSEIHRFYQVFAELVNDLRPPTELEINRKIDEIRSAVGEMSEDAQRTLLHKYLAGVVAAYGRIDIQGIGSSREALSFPIERQYTPLRSASGMPEETSQTPKRWRARPPAKSLSADAGPIGGTELRVPLTAFLSHHASLLIVGEPGAGKTTFLKLIACVLAKDGLGQTPPGRRMLLGLDELAPAPIPILLRLAALAQRLTGSEEASHRLILKHLADSFDENTARVLERYLDEGRCMLLLDGLDEVAEESARKLVIEIVNAAFSRWNLCCAVVTSRPYGFLDVASLVGVTTAFIDEFGNAEIQEFLQRWVRALYPEDTAAARRDQYLPVLRDAIISIPSIRRMARNPVMLTCLCVVHWNERRLPEGKPDLLAAVLRWLLNAKDENRRARGFNRTLAEECFKALAYAMTSCQKGKLVLADLDWAADELHLPLRNELRVEEKRIRAVGGRFLQGEMIDGGVIEQAELGQLRFWHLTFQEHYCARAIAELGNDERWAIIGGRLGDRQWSEVIDHLAGCLVWSGRRGVNDLVERILHTASREDLAATARAVGILGRILRILQVYDYQPPPDLGWEEARERALQIFTLEGGALVPVEQRIAAAEALGQAGDPRFDSFEPEVLPIPGVGRVHLGKYPVTVRQYESFVENQGYRKPHLWGDGWTDRPKDGWHEPIGWSEQLEHPTRPVTGVSWYEALAYCRWLAEVTGKDYRLPEAVDWVRAATNPAGEFPWGDAPPSADLLNCGSAVGRPTPVGIYPAGAAPGGHLDMAGNVWEWMGTAYKIGGRYYQMRGGGWDYPARGCRLAIRYDPNPADRGGSLGFRLSKSEP